MSLFDDEYNLFCTNLGNDQALASNQIDNAVNVAVAKAEADRSAVYAKTKKMAQKTAAQQAAVAAMINAAENTYAAQINNINVSAAAEHERIALVYSAAIQKADEQYAIGMDKQAIEFEANIVKGDIAGVNSLKAGLPSIIRPKFTPVIIA